jgi:putative tricarboxylic transport membrane protein
MLGRDGLTGLVVLTASVVLFTLTLDLKENPMVPLGPGFYPRVILVLTAVLAAALVVFDAVGRRRAAVRERTESRLNYSLVLLVFVIFGLYVALMPYVGFRIATLAFVAILQTSLEWPRGWKGWIVVGITALATTALAYFVFERYLSVLLPRGRWTDF